MIVTTYCTAQSLILQLISSDELLVLLWVSVIEVTVAGGGPIRFALLINPRPEGYGSRFVVHSFIHSVHRATKSSAHFFAPVKVRTG